MRRSSAEVQTRALSIVDPRIFLSKRIIFVRACLSLGRFLFNIYSSIFTFIAIRRYVYTHISMASIFFFFFFFLILLKDPSPRPPSCLSKKLFCIFKKQTFCFLISFHFPPVCCVCECTLPRNVSLKL